MKNLLVYLNPTKSFDDEHGRYIKIQIDNSLKYWKPDDILIATNFPYEYHGIKTWEVPDNFICEFDKKACKVNVIVDFLEKGLLNDITWYHDFEAFQGAPFDLSLTSDLGLTDYGWKPKWNTGSFFFKPASLDLFKLLNKSVYEQHANEEPLLWNMYRENLGNIKSRYQKLNITYNLGMRRVEENLKNADKPIKVWHFHPYRHNLLNRFSPFLPTELLQLITTYQ